MHPSPSVIIFTSFSGLGFGLLFWLGLGLPEVTGWTAFAFLAIAYLLAVGGLMASTFHLGHPERAIKAFSQWRSSWLSREAWASVLALVFMGLYGAGLVFLGQRWAILGILGSIFSVLTVVTTSMIYTQLKTVPRWNLPLTPALLLTFSLGGGALMAGQVTWALVLLVVAALVQVLWWIAGDAALSDSPFNLASATALGRFGTVRAFEPPHTGTNYLMKEMVHVVGRKHSQRLREISLIFGFVVPVVILLFPINHMLIVLAVLSHLSGVVASRWLFFAEAEHVVGLYYGKR